jgi:hypothetical protein
VAKWKRVALIIRVVAGLVLAGVLGFVIYQLYDFYSGRLGNSPVRVTQDYFEALGRGDFERVYELTDPASLYTLYGRRVTKEEVFSALSRVTGSPPRQFNSITVTRVARHRDRYYMQVALSAASGGSTRYTVQVVRVGTLWRVSFPFGLAP